jgi:hypothetical protein
MVWFARAASSGAGLLGPVSGIRGSDMPGWKTRTTAWSQLHRFVDQQGENVRCGDVATAGQNPPTRAYGHFHRFRPETPRRPRQANNGRTGDGESEVVIGKEPAAL